MKSARRHLVSLFALAALLASPASASAAAKVGLVSSAVQVARGYSLILVAGGKDVSVSLQKAKQGSSQSYLVSGTHGATTVGSSLAAGTVDANLGLYGSVHLHFSPGGGHAVVPPPSCKLVHPGRYVSGELTGTLHLNIGSHAFNLSRLPARAIKGATVSCAKPPSRPSHGLTLFQYGLPGTGSMSWDQDVKGHLFELAMLARGKSTDPASLLAFIYAKAPGSALTATPDLSSAQARAAGPYLSGSVQFARTIPALSGNTSQGSITGSFSMQFDLLGSQVMPNPAQGILSSS
jgi:hypothetical protein